MSTIDERGGRAIREGFVMLGAQLLIAFMIAQIPVSGSIPDPTALVERLGASRYADRKAAADAIEHIGRSALPALRAARNARDLEVRTRAGSLIQKIEAALLTEPTRLRLDFENATLPDVARSFALQTGFRLALYPQNLPRWQTVRVTLRQPQPVEFWKALDQLCDAAGLQYNSNMHSVGSQREPILPFTEGSIRTLVPTFDHGPFRVKLLGLDYQRHLTYGSPGAAEEPPPDPRPISRSPDVPAAIAPARLNPITTVQFSAQIAIDAEPRLSVARRGALRMIEAVDNRGNSLLPTRTSGSTSRLAADFATISSPVIHLQAPLHRPDRPGDTIKTLRGVIPVMVSSRRSDPLVVSLKDTAAGKTFENHDMALTVHAIRRLPNAHTLIELSVRNDDGEPSFPAGDVAVYRSGARRIDPHHLQIEVLDPHGQSMPWFQSTVDVETSHFTLNLTGLNPTTQPTELRYYVLSRSDVDVPFAFSDVPMP
jgi:hypothetical protein